MSFEIGKSSHESQHLPVNYVGTIFASVLAHLSIASGGQGGQSGSNRERRTICIKTPPFFACEGIGVE
jgi:hypothetical protein